MSQHNVIIERLATYTHKDAIGIGQLMPFLSQRMSDIPIAEELLTEIITSPYHEQIVARLNGKIVGAATLSIIMGPAVGKQARLEGFVTDPEIRGQGIGSSLWDEIVRWCNEHGVDLEFTSSPSRKAAHDFYLARGAKIRDTTVFHVHHE
jgi:GNAT superfamily N-acetyltransferase